MFKTQLTILKLFYKSSGWLLKLSFWSLPVALFISILSFLFIDNLLSSYERYLMNSYLGSQGRISIESENKEFMNALEDFSYKNKFIFSPKRVLKANVVFVSKDKKITKYAKFIILEKSYLEQKFKQKTLDGYTLFVNKVFVKSMGSLSLDKFKTLYFDDKNNSYHVASYIDIDTGFLGSEPIIYISSIFAQKLFGDNEQKMKTIEYLEVDTSRIKYIKDKKVQLAREYHVLNCKIHDLLEDTRATKELFEKVNMIQTFISGILFLLSLGVIVLSISVSVEFKKNSLKILQLIGMSKRDLSLTISGTIFLMILLSLGLALLSIQSVKDLFLYISNFGDRFFIDLDIYKVIYIITLAVILSFISYLSTRIIFGDKNG